MVSINSSFNSVNTVFAPMRHPAKVNFSGDRVVAKDDNIDTKNPVSRVGEYCLGIQKCVYKSLKTGGKAFSEILYYSSGDVSLAFCAAAGVACAIGAFILEFPINLYDANVNFFAKREQANADLANYATEKVLFDQIKQKGQTASEEEKNQLAIDFLKVRKAETGLRDYRNFSPFKDKQ